MNSFGIWIGAVTLLIIGLGFPLVILGERYLGYLWWPYMLGLGLLIIVSSLFIPKDYLSAITGVVGATFVWGSTELQAQSKRAAAGWFPSHPHKIRPPFEEVIKKWRAPQL